MIDLYVTLGDAYQDDELFEVRSQGDIYNGDLPDFNAAVKTALYAQFLAHPVKPLDTASLRVMIERIHQDVAAHDGNVLDESVDRNRVPEDLVDRNRDPEVEEGNEHMDTRDPDDLGRLEDEREQADSLPDDKD